MWIEWQPHAAPRCECVAVETDRNVTALQNSLIEWLCLYSPTGGSRCQWRVSCLTTDHRSFCAARYIPPPPRPPVAILTDSGVMATPYGGFALTLRHTTLGKSRLGV